MTESSARALGPYSLELRWDSATNPLPAREVRPTSRRFAISPLQAAPPWFPSGPEGQPFDFCGHTRRLLEDVVARCPDVAHVRPDRILIGIMQARSPRAHGVQARVTPLRFADGALTKKRRGHPYQVQRYFLDEHEYLYVLTFCVPRFLDQPFDDKMVTLLHELYHISPACDGDLRRHEGRYQLHTHSQKCYDRQMAGLARAYLATRPDPNLHAFLRLNFAQLCHRHGSVRGVVVPRPKIIPLQPGAAPLPSPEAADE